MAAGVDNYGMPKLLALLHQKHMTDILRDLIRTKAHLLELHKYCEKH